MLKETIPMMKEPVPPIEAAPLVERRVYVVLRQERERLEALLAARVEELGLPSEPTQPGGAMTRRDRDALNDDDQATNVTRSLAHVGRVMRLIWGSA